MVRSSIRSLRVLLIFSVVTGAVYPILITGLAQSFFPVKANGSIVIKEGKVLGSFLVGQRFSGLRYFHGRPSAADYDAASSGASNWGPTSGKLAAAVSERVDALRRENKLGPAEMIPADLVLSSASGLDPDISPEGALLQGERVAVARKLPKAQVIELVHRYTKQPQGGFLGAARVNVLKLNIALDDMEKRHGR